MVHDSNPVRHRHRLFLIVGDDHESDAEFLLQIHQLELRFFAQLAVKRTERLV